MTFKFLRAKFNGDPNIGLYGFATDDYCLLGVCPEKISAKIRSTLNTDIKITTITGTEFIGLFAAGNRNGIVLTKIIEDHELKKIKSLGINLKVIKSKETALGNLILCNDNGCIISERLKKYKRVIEDALGCEVELGRIANLDIVGSVSLANNRCCLCHS